MRILVVEDEILQAEMVAGMLQGWGHETIAADDGRKALEAVERFAPELILLDVFLPDATAVELIPQIKAAQPEARIITLTGQSSRELERRLRELGISYYMAKPFQSAELQSILSHLSGRPALRPGRRAKPVSVTPG
jgi:DNA-binding response OmpR family regulator